MCFRHPEIFIEFSTNFCTTSKNDFNLLYIKRVWQKTAKGMWRLLYWGLDMCFSREVWVFSHLADHRNMRHSAVRRIMITHKAAATRALLTYYNTSCNTQTVCVAESRIIIIIIRSGTCNTHEWREKKKVRAPPWTFISHYHWLPVSFISSFKANISGNLSLVALGKVVRGKVKLDLKRSFLH